jgi:WXG100 family type VII secretion target
MSDARIAVSTGEMRRKAGECRDLVQQFRQTSTTMFEEGRGLDSCWTGDAKQQFGNRLSTDQQLFNDLASLIEGYCATVETSATEYERAESQVRETVGRGR